MELWATPSDAPGQQVTPEGVVHNSTGVVRKSVIAPTEPATDPTRRTARDSVASAAAATSGEQGILWLWPNRTFPLGTNKEWNFT